MDHHFMHLRSVMMTTQAFTAGMIVVALTGCQDRHQMQAIQSHAASMLGKSDSARALGAESLTFLAADADMTCGPLRFAVVSVGKFHGTNPTDRPQSTAELHVSIEVENRSNQNVVTLDSPFDQSEDESWEVELCDEQGQRYPLRETRLPGGRQRVVLPPWEAMVETLVFDYPAQPIRTLTMTIRSRNQAEQNAVAVLTFDRPQFPAVS